MYSNILENLLKIVKRFPAQFLKGTVITLEYSAVAVLGGVIFGMILYFLRKSKYKILRFLSVAYIEFVRGTPILLHLYIFYFGDFGISSILPNPAAQKFLQISMALIFNSAAYVAEIFRAGIDAVDPGQMEAARCLGLNNRQAMFRVVIPQAIKNILPALCNEFITMIKETSLASTFFAGDIMSQYKVINGATYMIIEPLIVIAVIYFTLTFTLSKLVSVFERRLAVSD